MRVEGAVLGAEIDRGGTHTFVRSNNSSRKPLLNLDQMWYGCYVTVGYHNS